MKAVSFYHNDYLSKCDLINKYNSKDLYNTPKITNITLELPLLQISNLASKNLNSKNIFLKTYFIFYIIFGFKPYINYKAIKTIDKNYSLRFKISNSSQIQYFLHFLFLYLSSNSFLNFLFNSNIKQNSILKTKSFLTDNSNQSDIHLKNDLTDIIDVNKRLNFLFKVPGFCLYRLNIYGDFFLPNINLKELFFFLNVVFDSKTSNTNTKKLKNFPCFWFLDNKS